MAKQIVKRKTVVLGVTGSIAAYKAAELVRLLKKADFNVSVIMTRAATEFVGEITFRTLSQIPVGVDMFDKTLDWKPDHIALADAADVMVVAPCTANVIAKLANGLSDDLLSCTALASKAPLIIAPAMNDNMLNHPATQANLATLRKRGALIVKSVSGDLACGRKGCGRMADPADIAGAIRKCLVRNSRRAE